MRNIAKQELVKYDNINQKLIIRNDINTTGLQS